MSEGREKLVITFTLGSEQFAVSIETIQEIIRLVALTKLPRLPEVFEGVINLRGRVIPVMDLRRFLGNSECLPTRRCRIIISELNGRSIGFIVDTVMDVEALEPDMIEPPPDAGEDAGFITGVVKGKKGLFAILDVPKLLPKGTEVIASLKLEAKQGPVR